MLLSASKNPAHSKLIFKCTYNLLNFTTSTTNAPGQKFDLLTETKQAMNIILQDLSSGNINSLPLMLPLIQFAESSNLLNCEFYDGLFGYISRMKVSNNLSKFPLKHFLQSLNTGIIQNFCLPILTILEIYCEEQKAKSNESIQEKIWTIEYIIRLASMLENHQNIIKLLAILRNKFDSELFTNLSLAYNLCLKSLEFDEDIDLKQSARQFKIILNGSIEDMFDIYLSTSHKLHINISRVIGTEIYAEHNKGRNSTIMPHIQNLYQFCLKKKINAQLNWDCLVLVINGIVDNLSQERDVEIAGEIFDFITKKIIGEKRIVINVFFNFIFFVRLIKPGIYKVKFGRRNVKKIYKNVYSQPI